MSVQNNMIETQTAWVIFTGKTDLPWLKMLKKGFRHCFLVMNDGQRWISLDPLATYIDIKIHHHIAPEFDLPTWLDAQGYCVVQSEIECNHIKPAPLMIFSCVTFIKRALGIHKRFILTPWQLYQFLKTKKSKLNSNMKGNLSWVV